MRTRRQQCTGICSRPSTQLCPAPWQCEEQAFKLELHRRSDNVTSAAVATAAVAGEVDVSKSEDHVQVV